MPTKSRLLDMQVREDDTKTSLNDEIARRLKVQIFNFAVNSGHDPQRVKQVYKLK